MSFQIIPQETKINFVGRRFITFTIAGLFTFFGAFGYFKGLNYGIDFKGGHLLEIHTQEIPDLDDLREKLHGLKIGDVAVQQMATPQDLLIKIESQEGNETVQTETISKVKTILGSDVNYQKISTVGPKVGGELIANAVKAIMLSLIAMLIYIAVRFEWQFAACAIIALFHDCIAMLGLFSWTTLEFNETSVIAILITAGYSINDTIVIFDRIRENIRRFRKIELDDLINKSLNETLSRTIMTASTTLLALFALYFMGGPVISAFSLPIIVGITIGSFSSICLASPLLLYLNLPRTDDKKDVLAEKI
jgi:preprotein translocase subunit SecF